MAPSRESLVTVEGVVEDIIYQSGETGYTVCEIDLEQEPVTLVGIMPSLVAGETVKAMGEWVNHQTYGRQFKVSYFEKSMPVDETSMLRYLSSRAVRGVGPKLAERIVARFGANTFEVLENSPELLADIRGITLKKAAEISENFKEQFGVRNIMMFFTGFFGMATSVRIYKRWGNASVEIVKQNPYALCDEIYGIGFERADAMAAALGLEKNSAERIRAGLKYVLKFNAAANGHCYLPQKKLTEAAAALLGVEGETVFQALDGLCQACELIRNDKNPETAVYLPDYFRAEAGVANKLNLLNKISLFGTISEVDELIRRTEQSQGIRYVPLQTEAIRSAIENPVTILTGGPGTGKTTIIKAILNIFREVGMEIALAAPTGRAAKRMSLATETEAKTIHRLLEREYSPDETARFARNENNFLPHDVIIIDELSMVDTLLFFALLKAVKPGARLILIGDSDQLPSVGAGEVLLDTVESGCFQVCRLNQIFRQSAESAIIENAHRINRGEYPVPSDKTGDFFILQRNRGTDCLDTIVDLCKNRLPKSYGADAAEGIQVLSCTRKGELGTVRLNAVLQAALNPPEETKTEKPFREVIYRLGDKVMQIRNNYDVEWKNAENAEEIGFGIFNGEIGRITQIDEADQSLTILFDGKLVKYLFEELDEIEHAFAVTVHKSQGSEYPMLIMPVCNPPPMLATRNLIYTGITRAQKMVILVGDMASIQKMVDNNRFAERYTGLKEMYRTFREQG